MVCFQLKIYIGYLVAQLLLSLFLLGSQRLSFGMTEVLGPVLFSGLLFYLCKKNHTKIANGIVGLVIVLGVLNNLSLMSF